MAFDNTSTDFDQSDWDFGDGVGTSTDDNPIYVYRKVGKYTVTLTVTDSGTGETDTKVKEEYVEVKRPSAAFAASDLIRDGQGLVPLNDWAPLFGFTMTYDFPEQGDPAFRALEMLEFEITGDLTGQLRDWPKRQPQQEEILEFGLFKDYGKDGPDGILDPGRSPLVTWDNTGTNAATGIRYDQTPDTDLLFELNFTTPMGPVRPFNEWVIATLDPPGFGYIVAVRTSSVWQSGASLGYILTKASMLEYDFIDPNYVLGEFPFTDNGLVADAYSPDFYKGFTLGRDTAYSSSFNVIDMSGSWAGEYSPASDADVWSWPNRVYRPWGEMARPVSQGPIGQFLDIVDGEFLDIRKLFSLETWVAAVGLNLHGASLLPVGADVVVNVMQPLEINLVFTDIGADPYGPPRRARVLDR